MIILHNEYLALPADEQSTYSIKLIFKDENKIAVIPATLVWTLSAEDGQVINGRYKVVPALLASTMYITMYGDDLQLIDKKELYETRICTLEGTYNSTLGTNLPFKKQYFFRVRNVILVAIALSVSAAEVVFTNDYVEDVASA